MDLKPGLGSGLAAKSFGLADFHEIESTLGPWGKSTEASYNGYRTRPPFVPDENLAPVLPSPTEHKQRSRERSLAEPPMHRRSQAVDAVAHVDGLGRQVDRDRRRQAQHAAL